MRQSKSDAALKNDAYPEDAYSTLKGIQNSLDRAKNNHR